MKSRLSSCFHVFMFHVSQRRFLSSIRNPKSAINNFPGGPMSEASDSIESPPPADRPATPDRADARLRLQQLAAELTATRDRRCLIEYLRLRRALR
jgi:hypothetical protein